MPYLVGQTYTSSITVTDKVGNPVTPSGVTLTITRVGASPPDVSTPSVTPASSMSFDKLLTTEGLYRFEWVPVNPGAPQTEFVVCRGLLSVISLQEARDYLGVIDTRTDLKLQSLMMTATLLAEKVVGIIVPRTFTDEFIPGSSRPIIKSPHPPLLNITDAVTQIKSQYPGGPSWDATSLTIGSKEAGTVYPTDLIDFWYGPWRMTHNAGRLVPTENIVNGVREILWDLWAIHRNLFGDSDMPDLADVASYEAQLPADYHIPGRAAELLEPDRLPGFG